MRRIASTFLRIRYWIRPDVRDVIDGFGMVFAITLFFALIQAAHDGVAKRNREFDAQRWWYPIYQTFTGAPKAPSL
jgi:hypothetical protein